MNEYKIGDKIIVLGGDSWCEEARDDIGKKGIITEVIDSEEHYSVYIPESVGRNTSIGNGYMRSWWVNGREIKKVGEEQLLFSFMSEVPNE